VEQSRALALRALLYRAAMHATVAPLLADGW